MHELRPIDLWFIEAVLPHEPAFLARSKKLVRDGREARDLVHEAYSRLMQLDGWQAIANPRGYVMQMLQNLALQEMRRARIVRFEQLAEAGVSLEIDDAPDAFRIASGRQRVRLLDDAIALLPERNRQAVILRRVKGLSPREAADKLGISLSTFEKRLARGLALLALAIEGQSHDTGAGGSEDKQESPVPAPRRRSIV